MAAEAQGKVQRAVEEMLDNLEKEKLRPLLRNAHLGSAKCCQDTSCSKQQLESCMQSKFQPAQHIQETISSELNNLQNRLARCAKQCQDESQDKVSPTPTPQEISHLQSELDTCVVRCCDTHIELLPRMMMRINQVLQQVPQSNN